MKYNDLQDDPNVLHKIQLIVEFMKDHGIELFEDVGNAVLLTNDQGWEDKVFYVKQDPYLCTWENRDYTRRFEPARTPMFDDETEILGMPTMDDVHGVRDTP